MMTWAGECVTVEFLLFPDLCYDAPVADVAMQWAVDHRLSEHGDDLLTIGLPNGCTAQWLAKVLCYEPAPS